MADLKLATINCIESVEKTHATDNEKKFVGQCNRRRRNGKINVLSSAI